MIRQATEDTILTIPNDVGEEGTRTIAVQKGAEVVVDMVGVRKSPIPPHLVRKSCMNKKP